MDFQTTKPHGLNIPILPSDETCLTTGEEETYRTYEAYSLIISGCIICILCVLEKRSGRSLLRNVCWRRPALIFPVNLLDHGSDNFGYAMAFGSLTSHCFQLFTGTSFVAGPAWSRTLYIMMYVLMIGIMFYPLFACLTTDWVFVGSFLGMGYTMLWLYINVTTVISCPNGTDGMTPGGTIAVRLPVMLCLLGLFCRYLYLFGRQTARAVKARSPSTLVGQHDRVRLGAKHNVQYVKDLLLARCRSRGPSVEYDVKPPWHKRIIIFVRRNLYRWDPTFRYSPRVVYIFTVSLICAYQFSYIVLMGMYQLLDYIKAFYPNMTATNNVSDADKRLYYDLYLLQKTVWVSTLISFTLSAFLTIFSILQILTNYRENIKLLYKGQSKHLPFQTSDRHPIFILSDSLCYSGLQIAHILWGFLIVFIILLSTSMGLAYLIVLPVFNLIPRDVLKYLWNFIPGILLYQFVFVLQTVFSRALLQTRESLDDHGKSKSTAVLALDNRKVYHNISYFLFFFYIVLGVFGCFLTIIKGVILGVIYLARMDRCGLVSGFETWDTGYMYYVSFLHLEVSHRHPVLLVFCDLLLDDLPQHRNKKLHTYGTLEESSISSNDCAPLDLNAETDIETAHAYMDRIIGTRSFVARNRWFKAYTLLRNPCIRKKSVEDEYEILSRSEICDQEVDIII